MLLVLEDLHWAEPTALLLLRHLARALIDEPILLVASFRDREEKSTELLAALADLEGSEARRVALVGFDDAELSDLVASVTDAPSIAAAEVLEQLRVQTAGHPLYAVQLVRHLLESGHLLVDDRGKLSGGFTATDIPTSLLEVVWSRVQALGDATHTVLQAGSVLGIEFDEDTLVEMIDISDTDVTKALDSATGAGLLAETDELPAAMRFTHTLVAHTLYSQLRGARRRRLHERAARALEKAADVPAQRTVVELARHWALAGDFWAAQRWATEAGDYAFEHLAASEAATWYQTALDHAVALDRPDAIRAR